MELVYCFKCKKYTDTTDIFNVETSSKRSMIKGLCQDCKTMKCKLIPTITGGSGLEDIKEVEISEKSKILRQSTSSEGERDLLEKTYYSPESGFCGVNELQRKTKLPIKEVKEFLNEQDVYTLHKPARKNFKSQRVFVNGIDDQWQSDLVEMIPYEQENEGYRYLLTIIDCFSKFAWVVPLKSKSGKETADALSSVFTKSKRKPKKMQTDNGKEYYNTSMQKLFKSLEINHFSTYSDKKASIIERFNRTLKEKMWKMFTHQGNHKWVDILDDLVLGYNNHYHTSIKMTPTQASKIENERIVYNNLFPSKLEGESNNKIENSTKFKIGDTVRITKYKAIFDKGYLPNWSTE
ncbi:hypothetical protein L3Y34_015828 [Caenorhabditis briggsae]|uniref:Integrase catalytic domain-containing protein n=1 Tax=Caenorhabditis briggsae TaxID=6238 RepID=A0AAE9J099_CAEBR|nr:hypothetical protein L3Y34_015828 [Caenorhabditis briggsae]